MTSFDVSGSERLLASLLESVNDVAWCTTLDGEQLLFVNSVAERVYGRSIAELRSNKELWTEAIHPADRAEFEQSLARLLDDGQVELTHRIVRPDGDVRWLHCRMSVVHDASGRPLHVSGVATDITERTRAVEARQESEAMFDSLVEDLPLNIVRKDLDGKIVFGNQRYCQAMGATLEELLGKTDFDLFPVELARKYTADDRRVLDACEVFHEVEEHRTSQGEVAYVEFLKGPVLDAAGSVAGIQVMFW
ncbi:MAG: PAS domain S-box protein, partial [Pirellulaceae bacterium]|nr:PAS domain S-box protein [Pirellulaceae bacterium]